MKNSYMNNPKVGILLSQIDGTELTKECINSIKKCTYENLHFYIGDNFSKNLDIVSLFNTHSNTNFYIYKERLTYCETFNYLANKAIQDDCEFIFVLNNDTNGFSIDYFEKILTTFQDKDIGMVGSQCKDYDGNMRHSVNKLKNKFGESVLIPTEGFLVRSEAWESVGGFNESLKMYGEDIILISNLTNKGWKIYNNSEVSFSHLGGATIKKFPFSKIFLKTRNGVLILRSLKLPFLYKIKYFIGWNRQTLFSFKSKGLFYFPIFLIWFFISVVNGFIVKKLN